MSRQLSGALPAQVSAQGQMTPSGDPSQFVGGLFSQSLPVGKMQDPCHGEPVTIPLTLAGVGGGNVPGAWYVKFTVNGVVELSTSPEEWMATTVLLGVVEFTRAGSVIDGTGTEHALGFVTAKMH